MALAKVKISTKNVLLNSNFQFRYIRLIILIDDVSVTIYNDKT